MFLKQAGCELFSSRGSIGRKQFCLQYFCLVIPCGFIGLLAKLTVSTFLEWLLWSAYSLMSILIVFLIIKRLRDVGKSGWWLLFLFLPFVNVYVMYLLFLKKGQL